MIVFWITKKKHLIFSFCCAIKIVKRLSIKQEKKSWTALNSQPSCEDINRHQTSQIQTQKISQGAEEGCKVLNSPAPSDVVMLVAFLPGEDLINAEKQTRSARWRGCGGVRTVAHWTHPPVGRKRSCGKKANRSHARVSLTPPWTRDLTFRLLPITSARHSALVPRSAHAHVALCGAVWPGWRGAARAAACCSWRGQKNENRRVGRAITKKKKKAWTLDRVCRRSTGRENIMLQERSYKRISEPAKKHSCCLLNWKSCISSFSSHLISFDGRIKRAHSKHRVIN